MYLAYFYVSSLLSIIYLFCKHHPKNTLQLIEDTRINVESWDVTESCEKK